MREWPFSYWFNQTKQGVANKLVIWLGCIGVTRMTKALDQISLQFHRYGKRAFGTWSTSGWFFSTCMCYVLFLPKDIYRLLQPLRTMDSIHIRYRKYTQYWHPCHQQSNGAESNFMLTALSCLGVGRGQQRHQLHSPHAAYSVSNFVAGNPCRTCFVSTSWTLQHLGHVLFQLPVSQVGVGSCLTE